MQLRDILLVWPLTGAIQVYDAAQMSARRRRADYRRPGSLTYNRQQAARQYRAEQERDGPWV